MWPFRSKARDADRAIAVLDDAIAIAAEKWNNFSRELVFKDDVQLAERVGAFCVPMFEGFRKNISALRRAPDPVLLLIIAKGIEKAGTHSRAEIEQALGVTLPE